jgi:tetratricopeptide (TPR) repeat protein
MHLLQRENCLMNCLPDVERAARRMPLPALYMLAQAVQALQAGDVPVARTRCDALLASFPDQPAALQVQAAMFEQDDAWEQALPLLVRAAERDPDDPAVHNHLGYCLRRMDQTEQALASYDRAVQLAPRDPIGHCNRGTLLEIRSRFEESLESLERALALAPERHGTMLSLCALLHRMDRHSQALAVSEALLVLAPANVCAWINRACCQRALGHHSQALATLAKALLLEPDNAAAHCNMAYTLVEMGRWEEGWPMTEWRWRVPGFQRLKLRSRPEWDGWSSLDGKTVLLHNDQGLGDAIMLMRLAPRLAQRGAHIVLEVPPSLVHLATQIEGVRQVVSVRSESPPHDLQCPLFSLPGVLGLRQDNVPSAGGYLRADRGDQAAWARRLGPRRRPRIGIAWSGNPAHFLDAGRSIPLARFAQVLPSGAEVIALQSSLRESDAPALAERPWIRFFGEFQADFRDTAALCESVDLVVTVDTSIAHLAGALGKPAWVLLQHPAEYRWMSSGAATPWYDSLRLWRQAPEVGWDPLLEAVREGLERWAADASRQPLAA